MKPRSGWIVRHGVAADAAALAELGAWTFADTYGSVNRPEDMRAHLEASFGLAKQARELADPGVVTLLAFADSALVAYAQVRRGTPPPCVDRRRPVELHRFYVDRAAHGTGGAQLLLGLVHEAARLLGGRHLWLSVWERNPRALGFYRKMGFVDSGDVEFRVGGDRQRDRVFVTAVAAVPKAAADGGIYHLSGEPELRARLVDDEYRAASLSAEGFVHCALAHSVIPVADDYFTACADPVMVLAVDPRRLGDRVRYEAPAPIAGGGKEHLAQATLFPHVYGPIEADAITGIGVLERDAHGFVWPDRLMPLQSFLDGG